MLLNLLHIFTRHIEQEVKIVINDDAKKKHIDIATKI